MSASFAEDTGDFEGDEWFLTMWSGSSPRPVWTLLRLLIKELKGLVLKELRTTQLVCLLCP